MIRESRNESIVALIDGEHYPPVVARAISSLEGRGFTVKALVFLGGTEKIGRGGVPSYGDIPVYTGADPRDCLRHAVDEQDPDAVVDLSDEPVIGYRERFELICLALSMGVSYRGCDFAFQPHSKSARPRKPSLGVWGLGKRVGKTSLSGYLSRYLKQRGITPVVIAMGRGGPPEPEVLRGCEGLTCDELVNRAETGAHTASDHYEDAMMGDVVTVGCWRCGGGMAGEPCESNVVEGAEVAGELEGDLLVFEGSGSAIPPVDVDAVLSIVSALQPREYSLGYLGPYRLLLSDLVVVTMCEESLITEGELLELEDGIKAINPRLRVVRTVFRPRPLENITGKRVFVASTSAEEIQGILNDYLEREYGCEVVGSSSHLSDRERLSLDLGSAAGADLILTELKAAAVDVVSRMGIEMGKEVVFLENLPLSVKGELTTEIDRLEQLARERFEHRSRKGDIA